MFFFVLFFKKEKKTDRQTHRFTFLTFAIEQSERGKIILNSFRSHTLIRRTVKKYQNNLLATTRSIKIINCPIFYHSFVDENMAVCLGEQDGSRLLPQMIPSIIYIQTNNEVEVDKTRRSRLSWYKYFIKTDSFLHEQCSHIQNQFASFFFSDNKILNQDNERQTGS